MDKSAIDVHRRAILKSAAIGALAFELGGAIQLLTPAEARARNVPFKVLSDSDAKIVDALGRAIVPGADEAGLAHYLDQQLSAKPADALLMLRYLDVPPPYADFYRPALAAAERFARTRFGKSLPALDEGEASRLVGALVTENPAGWQGPPAPFFYFAFRADAVDVVYGTQEGFEKLDVPYLAHIEPPRRW